MRVLDIHHTIWSTSFDGVWDDLCPWLPDAVTLETEAQIGNHDTSQNLTQDQSRWGEMCHSQQNLNDQCSESHPQPVLNIYHMCHAIVKHCGWTSHTQTAVHT